MVKIIDCTLRDGGHLNNWEFTIPCIDDSYQAAINSNINCFELGYLEKLNYIPKIHRDTELIAMINIKDFSFDKFRENNDIKTLRLASYPSNIQKCFDIAIALKEKGYKVFINIMAASTFEDKDFKAIKNLDKNFIEALYFSDTYGALYPNDIENIIKKLRNIGYKKIGFHSHNNLQLAFANSIKAIENDIDYIDASAYGMGRGAGNLHIELLFTYLQKDNSAYIDLIKRHYLDLNKKYYWGYNLQNKLTAKNNVHPLTNIGKLEC